VSGIIKLSLQDLNFMFSQFAEVPSKVTWIRTPDYLQQLYISPSFEKIWGMKCEQLYEHPLSWNQSLLNNEVVKELKDRQPGQSLEDNTTYYTILDQCHSVHWIKDTCFHVHNSFGYHTAVAGIAEELTSTQWENEVSSKLNQSLDIKKIFLSNINELNIYLQRHEPINHIRLFLSGKVILLTRQESACLFYLSQGYSAKIIARYLTISPRTVEIYIDHLKKKLDCRTSLEVISKLSESLIEVVQFDPKETEKQK
jgi:DNA-binding CsgD family transcriptional regulator